MQFTDDVTFDAVVLFLFLRWQDGTLRRPGHSSAMFTTETSTKLGYSS